jgi:hypothetical protein
MDIKLSKSKFVDGRFVQTFGTNKRATFIVVQESFYGNNKLGVVDRVNIFIESLDGSGEKVGGSFSTSVIGLGDNIAGIMTEVTELLGKMLSWDNIEQCTVRLYEQ